MSTTTNFPTTDLYAVLGVQRDASAAAIKKAFRQLSLEHHPDKAGNSAEAHDKYVSIVEAYSVLKDAQKKAAQAEKAEQKQASKIANSVVTIKRVERNKRKFVTAVSGLEAFDLELKKVAKEFGKKFATGSSVTRVPFSYPSAITIATSSGTSSPPRS